MPNQENFKQNDNQGSAAGDASQPSGNISPTGQPWFFLIFIIWSIIAAIILIYFGFIQKDSLVSGDLFLQDKKIELVDKSGQKFYVNSEEIGQYEKFEVSFKSPKQYANPFDPGVVDVQAHFISPSGQEESWPAFWYQDYDIEKRLPKDEPLWLIRYTPTEIGEYHYYLTITEGQLGQEIRYPKDGSQLSFKSIKSNAKGYVGVSKNDSSYFAYENGQTFFPVGHGPRLDEAILAKYALYNMNIVQAEFNNNFHFEDKKLGEYDLTKAFKFDRLVEQAVKLGIYLQAGAMAGWPQFAQDETKTTNVHWDENIYNKVNGGILDYPCQFFSDESAKKYFKNKLRYYIARWGYSSYIFSWYLWGEYDNVERMSTNEGKEYCSNATAISWHQEMADYIKSLDNRHLVSTAEAWEVTPEIWNLESIDFVTIHSYSHPIDWGMPKRVQNYKDYNFNKPLLVQEYGVVVNPKDISLINEPATRAGYHNPLWQTTLMKLSGAPMKWTWYNEDYEREERMNLDKDYQVLGEFFKDSDLANEQMEILNPIDLSHKKEIEPITVEKLPGEIKTIRPGGYISPVNIYGLGNSEKAYLWLHDFRHSLAEIQELNYQPQVVENTKFQLNDMADGKYQVEFWDTRTGDVSTAEVIASQGSLIIEVPSFEKDIAVKLRIKD